MNEQYLWWQTGVIYQIYPRSFQDSNGDGVGDLPGMLTRLDYVRDLSVDAIWLSPIFTSPMADFGYDIADYQGIAPLFGTMADFDRLLQAAHARAQAHPRPGAQPHQRPAPVVFGKPFEPG
jgi:alpha-glucosidase